MKKKTKIYPWKMYFHVLLGMFFLLPALLPDFVTQKIRIL